MREHQSTVTAADLGRAIKVHRVEAGMTQGELAERMAAEGLPWHPSTVSKVESGDRECSVAELVAASRVFEVWPAEILNFAQTMKRDQSSANVARMKMADEAQERADEYAGAADRLEAELDFDRRAQAQENAKKEKDLATLRRLADADYALAAELRAKARMYEGGDDDAEDQ